MAEEAENKVMQHTKQRYKNLIDISVYASNGFTYIVGQQNPSSHQGSKSLWSVLKLSTNPETPDQLDATLAGSYCHSEVCELLRRLHEGKHPHTLKSQNYVIESHLSPRLPLI